jgi:Xaa-Pro aminopeptidase
MQTTLHAPELYTKNRQKLAQRLAPNSIAIFHSNDIMPTSADGTMPFVQQSDIYYLTGIFQEETVLVLFPDAKEAKHREILFIKETSETIRIWEGEKYTQEQASELSGIETVLWESQFYALLKSLVFQAENIYLNTNEHLRSANEVRTKNDRFIDYCKAHFPLHSYKRLAPLMMEIRAVKEAAEVEAIRQACAITEKGFRRLLSFVKEGVAEYEIQAELIHEFIRNRSRGFAYEPIIASGENSCVLHYVSNDKICQAGDIILLDVGAEYAGYASDMTRVLPVSGRFTARQKAVYNAVLSVKRTAMQLLTVGTTFAEYNQAVGEAMTQELIGLGLLDKHDVERQDPKNPLYKRYFMHGTSHFLGIDVHDYGFFDRKIEAGMVFTVEPGIYIREEKIGIRLENDILITPNGYEDLMQNIPIEADEIEDLMNAL